MNEHDATEVAFRNGYETGMREFAEKLKNIYAAHDGLHKIVDALIKEMVEDKSK